MDNDNNNDNNNEPNIYIIQDVDDDNDEEIQEENNSETETENEDEHLNDNSYFDYVPSFPGIFASPTFFFNNGQTLPHMSDDINNLQLLINLMTNNVVNPTVQNVPLISEINPANSSNSVLEPTTLTGQPINLNLNLSGTQQMIEEEVTKLIIAGNNNLHLVEKPLLDFIETSYLENMQYDDDNVNLIRYTIRTCINRGLEYELKEIVAGIMYYSLMGLNVVFSDNYDLLVLPMLQNEIKRVVTQSIRLAILRRAIHPPTMEDVKLVVKKDVLEKIPTSEYSVLESKIKSMNVRCTVCQDDFNDKDTVRVLPCEHIYHLDCIDDWLKEHSYKCPCCRKPAAEHSAKI